MSENKTDTESSKSEATTKTGQTQYKATRIWYEIINAFREEVPLKKHWRNFRTYQDCFSASEAVEWLYRYLKSSPNFKSHTTLTRQQAIQLLQIFLKEKIIEDVRASDIKFTFKDFQDDDRLYKFCTSNRFYKNATKAAEANKDQLMSSKSALKNEETTENASSKTGAQNESKAETKKTTDEKLAEIKENLINNKPVTNKENVKPVITNSTLVLNLNTSKASEKKKETYEEKSEVKLFNSKLSDSTNKVPSTINIQRADSLKRRPTISRAHHYNNGKLVSVKLSKHEEEIWSKVAQKLLESIIKKALAFNQTNSTQNQFTRHTSSSSVFLDSKNSGPENVQKLLFSGINDLKIIVGANIHHNCTHVNKHGVVIETEEDFPQWLVKAMTCLMNWKDEPDEFPRFQDVFFRG